MNASSFSAVLLAAGRSTRMGRDKALLEIDGQPLWRRQRAVLEALAPEEIFLSVRPEQAWARDGKFSALLFDDLPNAGPISGLTAALERTTHAHVIVLAVWPSESIAYVVGIGVLATGLLASIAAWRVVRLHPIELLRTE